jgi:hypothetical protein
MEEKTKATIIAANEIQHKDTKHLADYKKVFEYFLLKPATMFQCEIDTGIPRPYICWYVRTMRKKHEIQIEHLGCCPKSKCKGVQFLTTNKTLFKDEIIEPTLFDELWA